MTSLWFSLLLSMALLGSPGQPGASCILYSSSLLPVVSDEGIIAASVLVLVPILRTLRGSPASIQMLVLGLFLVHALGFAMGALLVLIIGRLDYVFSVMAASSACTVCVPKTAVPAEFLVAFPSGPEHPGSNSPVALREGRDALLLPRHTPP